MLKTFLRCFLMVFSSLDKWPAEAARITPPEGRFKYLKYKTDAEGCRWRWRLLSSWKSGRKQRGKEIVFFQLKCGRSEELLLQLSGIISYRNVSYRLLPHSITSYCIVSFPIVSYPVVGSNELHLVEYVFQNKILQGVLLNHYTYYFYLSRIIKTTLGCTELVTFTRDTG